MKGIIVIIGGVISAVTCLMPLYYTDGFTELQSIIYSIGITFGSGLIGLSYSLNLNKYWFLLLPISVLLLFYSFCYLYDYFLDFENRSVVISTVHLSGEALAE